MKTAKSILCIFAFLGFQAGIAGTPMDSTKRCPALYEVYEEAGTLMYKRIVPADQPADDDPIFFSILTSTDASATLRKYLEKGGNPNVCGPTGDTLLSMMAAAGNVNDVALLIEHGANPNDPLDFTGRSPLECAIHDIRYDIAQYLMDHGAKLLLRENTGLTLLGDLPLNSPELPEFNIDQQLEIARRLIDAGVDVNAGSIPPLSLATVNDNLPLMSLLLERGANPRIKRPHVKRPLDIAENQEALQLLRRYDALTPDTSQESSGAE